MPHEPPRIKKNFYDRIELLRDGILLAEQATFVSLFLKAGTIRAVGLPVKEFFIWGDDIEYTRRITIRGENAVLCGGPEPSHPCYEKQQRKQSGGGFRGASGPL